MTSDNYVFIIAVCKRCKVNLTVLNNREVDLTKMDMILIMQMKVTMTTTMKMKVTKTKKCLSLLSI